MKRLIIVVISLILILGSILITIINIEVSVEDQKGRIVKTYKKNIIGIINGKVIYYDTIGNILRKSEFEDSKKNGVDSLFYKNTNIESIQYWENNIQIDSSVSYYKSGSIKSISYFEHGVLNGNSKLFHSNGILRQSIPYMNGKINGIVKVFDNKGVNSQISFVKNDTVDKTVFFIGDIIKIYFNKIKMGININNHILDFFDINEQSIVLMDNNEKLMQFSYLTSSNILEFEKKNIERMSFLEKGKSIKSNDLIYKYYFNNNANYIYYRITPINEHYLLLATYDRNNMDIIEFDKKTSIFYGSFINGC